MTGPEGVPAYPIGTPRLLLRPFRIADNADHAAYETRTDVARFLPYDARTEPECEQALARKILWNTIDAEGQRLVLAIEQRSDGTVIGETHLVWADRKNRQGEIGFVLHPDSHGLGLAREAVTAVLDLAFGPLALHRVYGRCDALNDASVRLMTRLGMRQEAHLVHDRYVDGRWRDLLIYAITAPGEKN